MQLADFLARYFPNAEKRGRSYFARCCCHDEKTASLEISEGKDGTILCHCFGCGANGKQVCAALGIEVKELFPPKEPPNRKKRDAAPPKPLTLEEFAAAKKLPIDWLREEGLENFPDGSGIGIGYFFEDGAQH